MKLHVLNYLDSAGDLYTEWFSSENAIAKRRDTLRKAIKEAGASGFGYAHTSSIIDVPTTKEGLLDFLNAMTGTADPVFDKGQLPAIDEVEEEEVAEAA